ncbi:vWA domain-containing protein [Candidatus Thiosymbion oneisti]|uniref:vWA domain-containing protein n=1 Tax=Candidatus Thiosymbion oneisti TaxID=589554 RepID=UPI000B7DDC11|nr:vWA domain-containing protein [Candidatus Thiosymbion oneisti]
MIPSKTHLRKLWQIVVAVMLLWWVWVPHAPAANDDFIILLDQSGSMLEKRPGDEKGGYFEDPQKAEKSREALEALDDVIKDVVEVDDYITIIPFGSGTKVVVSQQLRYPHERTTIKNIVFDHLRFRDRKTDIVAGIKEAGDLISELGSNPLAKERRKILVMITDGKNDPPQNSEFFSPEAQDRTYEDLKDKIKSQNWKVTLVGLGDHTDIADIGRKLGLDKSDTLTVESGANIRDRLVGKIRKVHDAQVQADTDRFKIRVEPGLFGGYDVVSESLSLHSTFLDPVTVELNPSLVLPELQKLAAANVTPAKLEITPGETQTLTIQWQFTGDRPEDGVLRGHYKFAFPPHATPFYPNGGEVELVVVSWWDRYGLRALFALVVLAVVLWLVRREIRKRQVPEIRVMLVAGPKELSEKQTLRKHQKIAIANGDLAGGAVPAEGLEVKQAAAITYLGRKRFRVSADEAILFYEGAEKPSIEIGLDEPFDLKDDSGHKLGGVMISTSGALDDPFGAGGNDGPF